MKFLFSVGVALLFLTDSANAAAIAPELKSLSSELEVNSVIKAYETGIKELQRAMPSTSASVVTPSRGTDLLQRKLYGTRLINEYKRLEAQANSQGATFTTPAKISRTRVSSTPSGYSSTIVRTPSVSRSSSSNNFSVDGSRLLPRKIDFGEGGLNHGASDYEIVAKKSQIINALKHWIDSSLYTLGGDAGKLLQDYVDQHQPSDDSVDSVWKDVSGIEMRGSFKSRLEEIVGAVPLQKDQNPTEQKLSVIKAVCDWIDEISPGEDTRDFLKYDPLRAPAGQRIHHFPDARNPDAPTDKSKGAFKMAIRAKILEAF